MFALTITEILFLLLMAGSADGTELVGLVQADQYFQARQIEPTIDRMIDFVIVEPKTAKLQIRQLVALRYLADQAAQFKKANNYQLNRMAIEEIAAGTLANDPQGFAADHAKRLLDKLDGVKRPAAKPAPLRAAALDWFPADTQFAWAVDLRQTHGVAGDPLLELTKLLSKDVNRQLHDQLEKTGNIRIDRVAFGFAPSRVKNSQKIFFRITGKGNPAWLADVMASSSPGLAFSKRKTADGVSIVTLSSQFGGAGAFLSDTDLLFVGERSGQANQDLIDEMLEYRDKKKPGAAAGVLKDRLAKIPDHAIAIAVCDLPAEGRKNLSHLVDPFPAKISAYAERTPQGFDLKAETLAADATEAGKLAKSIGAMRKESIKSIQEAMKQPEPGAPAPPYPMIINLLESIQVQSDEQKVNLRGLAPAGLLERLVGPAMYYDPPRGFLSPRGPRYR